MSTTPRSGKYGTAKIGSNAIAEVTKWSINKSVNTTRYASNATGGFKRSIPGVREASGSIEFKLDMTTSTGGQTAMQEGSTGELKLYPDITDSATTFWDFTAVTFKSFKVDVDIDSGNVIGGSADWENDGTWTEPTY